MNFMWQILFGAVLVTTLSASAEKHVNDDQYYHNKCQQSPGAKANCKLDLTVAVDMSWAMKSRKNVLKLANFTIDKIIDQYAINHQYSRVSVQTLGSWAFSQSPYFDQFSHVCEFISHAADTFPFFGNDFFQLSKVFKSYLLSNILPTPKKRVLVIFTAINDPFNINAAVPLANLVRKKAHVVIVGINQKSRKYLERIADDVIFTGFNDYSVSLADNIVSKTCPGSESGNTTTKPVTTTTRTTTIVPSTTFTTTTIPSTTTTTVFVEPTSTVISTTEKPVADSTTIAPEEPTTTTAEPLPTTTVFVEPTSTVISTTEGPVADSTTIAPEEPTTTTAEPLPTTTVFVEPTSTVIPTTEGPVADSTTVAPQEPTTTTAEPQRTTTLPEQTTSLPQEQTTTKSAEESTTYSNQPSTAEPNEPSTTSAAETVEPSTLQPEASSTKTQAPSEATSTLQPENPTTTFQEDSSTLNPNEFSSTVQPSESSSTLEPITVEPSTFSPNQPTTDLPSSPTTDSSTSKPEESSTLNPNEPSTSLPEEPTTHQALEPSTAEPNESKTDTPYASSTPEPFESTTTINVDQSTVEQSEASTTVAQQTSATTEEHSVTSEKPEESSTMPIQNSTPASESSTTQSPSEPSTPSSSVESSTIQPEEPTTDGPLEFSTVASVDGSTEGSTQPSSSDPTVSTTNNNGEQTTVEEGEASTSPSQQTSATTQGTDFSTNQPQVTSSSEEPATAKTNEPSSTSSPTDESTAVSEASTTAASNSPSESPTEEPINPSTQPPLEPVTSVSNEPTTQKPDEASTDIPENPSTANPIEPSSSGPDATEFTKNPTSTPLTTDLPTEQYTTDAQPEETSSVTSEASTDGPSELTTKSQPLKQTTAEFTTFIPIETTNLPTTPNPLSDALGSSCSTNTTGAWLDIVFVIDTSAVLTTTQLNQFGGLIAGLLRRFTIDQTAERSTRVAIVTYATESFVQYDLTSFKDWTSVYSAFSTIGKFRKNEKVVDISQGLSAADKLLKSQKSHRIPAIVLVGASPNTESIPAALPLSKQIIADGTKIVTINFAVNHDASEAPLNSLASPSFGFVSNDPQLYSKLTVAFTKVNCVCPKLTFQFQTNSSVFGDCIQGFNGQTPPDIAQLMCEMSGGTLVSVTSQQKMDFIRTQVVKNVFGGNLEFTIGLHRIPSNNNKWFWFGYNNTVFPLGDFKKWEDGKSPSESAACGFATREASDNALAFAAGGCDYEDARPYLCQTKACDSNHFCDLESGVKAAKAHLKLQSEMKQRSFRSNNFKRVN